MRDAIVRDAKGKYEEQAEIGPHKVVADAPKEFDGEDLGPEPHELLLAALGACTAITMKMYAGRKGWPLRHAEVKVHLEKKPDGHHFQRTIRLEGDLDEEQRARLLDIANKCPVHTTLTGKIAIETELGR